MNFYYFVLQPLLYLMSFENSAITINRYTEKDIAKLGLKDNVIPELIWNNADNGLILTVAKSTIPNAGKGVFTQQLIKKGQRIGVYLGDLRKDPKRITNYSFTIDKDWYIDSSAFPRCIIAMVNDVHGTKLRTNAEFRISEDLEDFTKTSIVLYATKDILPGMEIFASYGPEYWKYW